jgi:hypothetical protein
LDVIGSQQLDELGAVRQQLGWPAFTRTAAWLYFARTTSFTSLVVVMATSFR